MEIKKVEGIIISDKPYGESSKILNIMTSEYGIIGVLAKGSKKIKSSLTGVTGKLTLGNFYIYYKQDKLSTLISVDVINSFKNIRLDLDKINYAAHITNIVSQILRQDVKLGTYELYISALTKIDEGLDYKFITSILELKLLDILGVMPIIDGCAICLDTKNIVTLSSDKGGFVCKKCYKGERMVSPLTIKIIRMLMYVDMDNISKVEVDEVVKLELAEFLSSYYEKYTGIYINKHVKV